ncbi:MAG: hypothetical protein DI634_10435 [Kocuria palustris]|nr:MAG: hypothetical protein DI634_10435 [Kocuria palustris]
MRVALVDAYGTTMNRYMDSAMRDRAPQRPWAMYLAGADDRFRFLAFDLDAHGDAAAPLRDLDVLTGHLVDAGIPFLVCKSGPSGGRHVWVGLAESVDADTVATLNRLVKHLCPSLDLSPLSNARTGCVRPPGAPHRSGGVSTPLAGSLDVLTDPQTPADAIRGLVTRLAALVDDTEPADAEGGRYVGPIPVDAHRRLYLVGRRRELPAPSATALRELPAGADASAHLWRVLIGAAAARWRHADVAALVDDADGLEHVRTRASPRGRTPRPRREQAAILARQWDKAVRYVANSSRQIGDDPTFDRRADRIAAHVRDVQERADAAAGRWTRGGGPADRRILDVLCVIALHALRGTVEADTRRLALLAGVGRETARTALLRLAQDGWIAHAAAAEGPRGAHWTIDPKNALHSSSDHARSQADPRPPGAGAAERNQLLATLRTRTTDAAHDLFTSTRPALGHLAGNIYAHTDSAPATLDDLARSTGAGIVRTARLLDRLAYAGIVEPTPTGWVRSSRSTVDAAAERAGVAGRLDARALRYRVEREVWAWWKAEETWMHAPRRPHAVRRPGRGQLSLVPDDGTHAYGPHPRRPDGRLDFAEARRVVVDERTGTAARDRAPKRADGDLRSRTVDQAQTVVEPLELDDTDRMMMRILGAVRIA